ncbi:hypothetical protein CPT_Sansa71 [Caulobacter phage Sansa]|uniref:Uncharacterized protein n=1 Tax=Caulobacter phage Sansa TaxID=1675600 RepID=A0A0K1LMX8_9CAUD|nr:hypothetical protein HOR07_gp071 [Caulobacter phage Sansa]AKU43475.1 hypothetical protein CPT_Sansa71 [Caulobacter phage Sansa]
MTDNPPPPGAADIALIADIAPRRQDQDPETFTIYEGLLAQRAAQIHEIVTYESGSLWSAIAKPPPRGIYVDKTDDDLWAEAVAVKRRRDEHLRQPVGQAGRALHVLTQVASEALLRAQAAQSAQRRSFANEIDRIEALAAQLGKDITAMADAQYDLVQAVRQARSEEG